MNWQWSEASLYVSGRALSTLEPLGQMSLSMVKRQEAKEVWDPWGGSWMCIDRGLGEGRAET